MSYSKKVDRKWQKIWDEMDLASFDEKRIADNLYVLEMFPTRLRPNYTSVTHNYSLSDSYARMKKCRASKYSNLWVLIPWSAAENYAIATGSISDSTRQNIESMREQLKEIGALQLGRRAFHPRIRLPLESVALPSAHKTILPIAKGPCQLVPQLPHGAGQ